jgi:acyl transferase domain-containing protein
MHSTTRIWTNRAGAINSKGGYFLQQNVKLFDNLFFGIHNLEARYIDPQQRQLLKVVYKCLENAGESLESVSGANISCYVANFASNYVLIQAKDSDLYYRYSVTGFGPTSSLIALAMYSTWKDLVLFLTLYARLHYMRST